MPANIKIDDEDIVYAEKMLLSDGQSFDSERREFIKCLESLDLQAVPGSGKTTALLAKLLILERHLPLEDGSGVLVISHTNAAVNEIRERIAKRCPALFSYPNFVGTIQGFVDTFIAIPSFVKMFGFRPTRIDADTYDSEVAKYYQRLNPKAKAWIDRKHEPVEFLKTLRFDQELNLTNGLGGKIELSSKNPSDTYKTLAVMKNEIFKRGLLHFEDVYYFAESMLGAGSGVCDLIRGRFRFVFVDEMQDMTYHQESILERIFGAYSSEGRVFQKVGDPDQAIFRDTVVSRDVGRATGKNLMTLKNSLRLSPKVASILTPFAFNKEVGFHVHGLNQSDLNPHLLVYDDESMSLVVQEFAKLVSKFQSANQIPSDPSSIFKAIAWNSTWSEPPDSSARMVRLIDFCPEFQTSVDRKQTEFESLHDHLLHVPDDRTLRSARNSVLDAIVQALRLEDLRDPRNSRYFTKASLINYYRDECPQHYEQLKLFLLRCAVQVAGKNCDSTVKRLRETIPKILQHFGQECVHSKSFLDGAPSSSTTSSIQDSGTPNSMKIEGITVHIGTVHSVKGQTHTGTLYIESYYHRDGSGVNAKSYESQRLAEQFKGNRIPANAGSRVQQSARMVYVGFSRPTHLLAFAVHKERFESHLKDLDPSWEIVKLYLDAGAS